MATKTDKHVRNASKCDSRELTTRWERKCLHLARNMNKNSTESGSMRPKRYREGLCEGFLKLLMLKYAAFHASSSLFAFYGSLFPSSYVVLLATLLQF